MYPKQEVANAFSMLSPLLVVALATYKHWPNGWLMGLLIGSCAHLPASLAFHLRAACVQSPEFIHGDLCLLDQSMLHVTGTVFAFVLSRGHWPYTLFHLGLTLSSVQKLWCGHARRWPRVAISVLLWLLPMLWISPHHFFGAMLLFYVGGIGFVFDKKAFGGWGHALFHIATAGTMAVMCQFILGHGQKAST